jgi:hypothetical protein
MNQKKPKELVDCTYQLHRYAQGQHKTAVEQQTRPDSAQAAGAGQTCPKAAQDTFRRSMLGTSRVHTAQNAILYCRTGTSRERTGCSWTDSSRGKLLKIFGLFQFNRKHNETRCFGTEARQTKHKSCFG